LKTEGETKLSVTKTIFAGGMAGILNWIVAIPADVIKSRLQTGTAAIKGACCSYLGTKYWVQTI
jgi:hypothetical protein